MAAGSQTFGVSWRTGQQSEGDNMSIESLWLVLACVSVALLLGGGIYESSVVSPLWSADPPGSFRVVQKSTGVPPQRFWIPVHIAITVFLVGALITNWGASQRRTLILVALASYIVMRVWSAFYFIPEMLRFQQIPVESEATQQLLSRANRWTRLSWFREPLDLITQVCLLVALSRPLIR